MATGGSTAARPARGGRRPTAAAPRWGHTCLICPDQPSVQVEVAEAGETGTREQAWADFNRHLDEDHPELFAKEQMPLGVLAYVSLRTYAGPTARAQQRAA